MHEGVAQWPECLDIKFYNIHIYMPALFTIMLALAVNLYGLQNSQIQIRRVGSLLDSRAAYFLTRVHCA
jgi:hypothetical protein